MNEVCEGQSVLALSVGAQHSARDMDDKQSQSSNVENGHDAAAPAAARPDAVGQSRTAR